MTADSFVCCVADVTVPRTVAVNVGITIYHLREKTVILLYQAWRIRTPPILYPVLS